MVRKNLIIILILIFAFLFFFYSPSDQKKIEKTITKSANALAINNGVHPLESLRRIKTITSNIDSTLNIIYNFDNQQKEVTFSKSEIEQQLLRFIQRFAPLNFKIRDFKILINKTNAEATFTVLIKHKLDENFSAQELKSFWKKIDSTWKIYKIENIQVIY